MSSKEFIEQQNIFNYDVLKGLIKNIDQYILSQVLWDFYMFQLWYERYMSIRNNMS